MVAEEGLLDLVHDRLPRVDLAATNEDRRRLQMLRRPGEDRSVDDVDNVLWIHIVVTEKDVDT